MKLSPTVHRTKRRERAFTLVELAVAGSLIGVLGLVVFGVLRSGALLSSQNTSINVSALRARTALDQIGDRSRYSLEVPALIDKTGALVTDATAEGILLKVSLGSPYVVKGPAGTTVDIPSTANQFVIEYRQNPATMPTGISGNWTLPAPSVGDWISMETISRPQLQISAVSAMTNVGDAQRVLITTTSTLGELARPSYYRIGGYLFRKEAYVFVSTETGNDPRYELRHFSRILAGTDFSSSANYQVQSNGYRKLNNQAFFTNSTSNSTGTTTLRALVNASDRQEYISRQSKVNTFTTVPISLRLWSLNR